MERTKKEKPVEAKKPRAKKAPEVVLGKAIKKAIDNVDKQMDKMEEESSKAMEKVAEIMGMDIAAKPKWRGGQARFRGTFQMEVSISIKFWALIPSLNLNLSKGMSTVEIEFLCFGLYFDFVK